MPSMHVTQLMKGVRVLEAAQLAFVPAAGVVSASAIRPILPR
jgi:hypothetical protein